MVPPNVTLVRWTHTTRTLTIYRQLAHQNKKALKSLLLVVLALAFPALAHDVELTAKPVGIDDGDTFIIQFRSQGIDTPEKKQLCENADGACYACGQNAKNALLDMIRFKNDRGRWQFKTLRFKVWTTGRYGRPVVTAYDGDRDIHLALIEQGWAVAYRQYLPAPLKGAYLAAEAEGNRPIGAIAVPE